MVQDPIIVLGAARSGTTMLGQWILAGHPDVAYWAEPNHVWRFGHAYRRDDLLVARHAKPHIRRHIREQFTRYLERHGGTRLMEKTPGNCLRMPFVLRVFPRAQVVHVLRDGRDVALSAAKEWAARGTPRVMDSEPATGRGLAWVRNVVRDQGRLRERLPNLRSWLELPAHLGRLANVILRGFLHTSRPMWGPRIPGLRSIRRSLSLLETCALQWDVSVRMARSACAGLPAEQYLELRYENLVNHPQQEVERVLAFLNLARPAGLIREMTARVEPQQSKWRRAMNTEQLRDVELLIADTLRSLGYELGSPAPTTAPGVGSSLQTGED